MGKYEEKHRKIYRKEYGIKWDGGMYDIHHINGRHEDNSIDNLILIPSALHCRLHAIIRRIRFDLDSTLRDFTLDAYIKGTDGEYLACLEWFSMYAEIVQELAFWGKMKEQHYRGELTGDLLPIEGITEYE